MIKSIIRNNEKVEDVVEQLKKVPNLVDQIFYEYDYLGAAIFEEVEGKDDPAFIDAYKNFVLSFVDNPEFLEFQMKAFKNKLVDLGYSSDDAEDTVLYSLAIKLKANTC